MDEKCSGEVREIPHDDHVLVGCRYATHCGKPVLTCFLGIVMRDCYDPCKNGKWEVEEVWETIAAYVTNSGRQHWAAGAVASVVVIATMTDEGTQSPKFGATVLEVDADVSVDPLGTKDGSACIHRYDLYRVVREWMLNKYCSDTQKVNNGNI